jgi:hypothetical protein
MACDGSMSGLREMGGIGDLATRRIPLLTSAKARTACSTLSRDQALGPKLHGRRRRPTTCYGIR